MRGAALALAVVGAAALAVAPPVACAKPRRPPVVVLVLDEFPTDSITRPDGRIDSERFPGFAALARGSTWFRNAWSVYDSTPQAMPAILTGRVPARPLAPTWRNHRQSLFTVLGAAGYRMHAFEEATTVCPPRLCPRSGSYGKTRPNILFRRPERLAGAIASIRRTRRPTLYFHHSLLPHVPWRFSPSGRGSQGHRPGQLPDFYGPRGFADAFLTEHNQQRHLLQVGFVDRAVGRLVARLRATGLYRRALVVVTADHGISFARGTRDRRTATRTNLHEVAPVPLFVKRPGQVRGGVSRAYASTADVLPTVASALRLQLRRRVDGRPAFGASVARRRGVSVVRRDFRGRLRLGAAAIQRRRARGSIRRARLFGTGPWEGVYAIGPRRELLGRSPGTLTQRPAGFAQADFATPRRLGVVDPTGPMLPTWAAGQVFDSDTGPRDLALAVNGSIRAVGRTFSVRDSTAEYFSLVYPESALVPGRNSLTLYEVSGERPELTPLGSAR